MHQDQGGLPGAEGGPAASPGLQPPAAGHPPPLPAAAGGQQQGRHSVVRHPSPEPRRLPGPQIRLRTGALRPGRKPRAGEVHEGLRLPGHGRRQPRPGLRGGLRPRGRALVGAPRAPAGAGKRLGRPWEAPLLVWRRSEAGAHQLGRAAGPGLGRLAAAATHAAGAGARGRGNARELDLRLRGHQPRPPPRRGPPRRPRPGLGDHAPALAGALPGCRLRPRRLPLRVRWQLGTEGVELPRVPEARGGREEVGAAGPHA
mmetsp:Transcript_28149/g.80751  ORF Transcript_28149/g.80751 Transcript_28149/m.80751 type:complete len:258 (+) Transcript_28149:458-1231(+)